MGPGGHVTLERGLLTFSLYPSKEGQFCLFFVTNTNRCPKPFGVDGSGRRSAQVGVRFDRHLRPGNRSYPTTPSYPLTLTSLVKLKEIYFLFTTLTV